MSGGSRDALVLRPQTDHDPASIHRLARWRTPAPTPLPAGLTATSGAITQHASKGTTNLVYSRALTKKALTATVQLWDITTRVGSTSVGLQLAAQPAADVTVAVSSTWSGVTVSPASLTFTSSELRHPCLADRSATVRWVWGRPRCLPAPLHATPLLRSLTRRQLEPGPDGQCQRQHGRRRPGPAHVRCLRERHGADRGGGAHLRGLPGPRERLYRRGGVLIRRRLWWGAPGRDATPRSPSSHVLPCTTMPPPLSPADAGVYSVRLADTRAPLGDTMQNPIVVTQLPYSAAFRIEEWPYNVDVSSACQSSSFKGGADAYFAFK